MAKKLLEAQVDDGEDGKTNGVLQHYAYRAITFAERFLTSQPPCPEQAGRWFHTALVFLEVLKAGARLEFTDELERVRLYASQKTRMYSHLLGNLVPLNADKDVRDLYDFEDDKPALGQGSYGIVIKATHKQTGQHFACKILFVNRASTNSAKEITKLHSEVSIMRELDHPHIVRLREVFYARRRIYLIMDLCTGGNLLDFMKRHPNHPDSEPMAKDFLRQMLYAIKYLHEHQIVHRDLKLENWLLQSSHHSRQLKLIDFGLSKFFNKNELMVQSVGSLYYVAPEVLENGYSETCDMWSVGVIAYMLLFGRPPFWGNNNDQMRARIKNAQYSFPHDMRVSKCAKDFVQMLLVKDTAKRMTAHEALNHFFLVEDDLSEGGGGGSLQSLLARNKGLLPLSATVSSSLSSSSSISTGLSCTLTRAGFEEEEEEGVPHDQVLSSLVEFSAFGTLKRLILEVMAFNLTPIQIENLGRVFRAIDKKQKGTISLEDIKDYLMNEDEEVLIPQGIEVQMNAVEKILTSRKSHHEINYNDFVAAVMWRRIQYDEEKMHMVFEALDVHRQGFLTPDSIRQVVGLDKNQEEIDRMFKEADVNTDGCIDYSDFVKNWKRHVVDVQYTPMVKKIDRKSVV